MQWQIQSYDTLDSTNQEAGRLIRNAKAEEQLHGMVLVARQQTGGKGRLGRVWESPAGTGLWMTTMIRLQLPIEQASLYSFAAAVAVAEGIEQATGLNAQLKWPNDVLLDGKKLCGILLELIPRSKTEQYIAMGIGINVNQKKEDFPPELQEKAASIAMYSGKSENCEQLLLAVLQRLEENCTLLETAGFAPLRDKWKQRSCIIGCAVSVQQQGTELYNGIAEDLAMDGTLLVRTEKGVQAVVAGDVSLRTTDGGYSFSGSGTGK